MWPIIFAVGGCSYLFIVYNQLRQVASFIHVLDSSTQSQMIVSEIQPALLRLTPINHEVADHTGQRYA